MPYTRTGPAMVNSRAPVPSTQPSGVNSMAGEVMALAKPVIGTPVPAPAYRAMRSNTPIPVSSAVKNTNVMEAKLEAEAAVIPSIVVPASIRAWPKTQMQPPTQKARRHPWPNLDLGVSRPTKSA